MATVREQFGLPPVPKNEPVITWKAFEATSPLIFRWVDSNYVIEPDDPGCDRILYDAIEAVIKDNYERTD